AFSPATPFRTTVGKELQGPAPARGLRQGIPGGTRRDRDMPQGLVATPSRAGRVNQPPARFSMIPMQVPVLREPALAVRVVRRWWLLPRVSPEAAPPRSRSA